MHAALLRILADRGKVASALFELRVMTGRLQFFPSLRQGKKVRASELFHGDAPERLIPFWNRPGRDPICAG
jgi:hypothetical protein